MKELSNAIGHPIYHFYGYHILTDGRVWAQFVHLLCAKTREELDGSKFGLFSNYYEMASKEFNNKGWIPDSIALPELHPELTVLNKLFLNIALITSRELQDKLISTWY